MMKIIFWLALLIAAVTLASCSSDKGSEPDPDPEPENHAPMIAGIRDTTVVLGDTLRIAITASDEDGDALGFGVVVPCSWSELQQGLCPEAGVRASVPEFWFWPRSHDADVGWRGFTVVVSDGRGGSDSTGFGVTILEP